MKHVRNTLKQLALEHGARRGRYYGVRQIARESGASRTVVDRLMRNELRRLPMDDLARLCAWLDCQPGDLLYIEEEHATGEPDGFFRAPQPPVMLLGEEHAQQIADQTSRKNERQD